jgi:ribose-phosphate pyrophosphokinase
MRNARIYLAAPALPPVNESFFLVLDQIRALAERGASVRLITPYLPYARSDKADLPGMAIIGKLITDLIEQAGVEAAIFVRAHSPQSQGFFNIPAFNLGGRNAINEAIRAEGVQMIISPDAGFQKDATLYATELNLPLSIINKKRDPITGKLSIHGISGDPIAGLDVAVIDDETASGETLDNAAAFLKKNGARKVVGVVSHLAGDAQKARASKNLDRLVVTNTFPIRSELKREIKVVSIASEIGQLVKQLEESEHDRATCTSYLTKLTY